MANSSDSKKKHRHKETDDKNSQRQGDDHSQNKHSDIDDRHDHHDHSNGGHDENHGDHHKHMAADFRRRFWVNLILSVPVLLLADLIRNALGIAEILSFPGDGYVQFSLATVIFIYGGYPFLKGFVDEVSERKPGMMTLISLAIAVAYGYSAAVVVLGVPGKTFFWELATLIAVMLLGHWVEMNSVMGASRALDELARLLPSDAHRLKEEGSTEDVPIKELAEDDRVLIKPGEKIPADGKVIEGVSAVNESLMTGESEPVKKSKDDEVIGGAINGDGSLTVQLTKAGNQGYLSQVMDLVKEVQGSKSKTQNLADRAALWLTVIAISVGVITLFAWLLVFNREFYFALGRAVTVMVITCPHALGLAIPLVVAVSTSLSAKNGLLIRNRGPFESSRNIDTVVFDKTGTLTKGSFEVGEVKSFNDDFSADKVRAYAASLESRSEHPIARAVAEAGEKEFEVDSFESMTGKGVRGKIEGKDVRAVSPGYVKDQDYEIDETVRDFIDQGKTTMVLVVDDKVVGAIVLEDPVREESKQAVRLLNDLGITTMIITGDNNHVAERVARGIGIDDYIAGVLPDKKAEEIKKIQGRDKIVAMVGDGINDAPALTQADVGIAIGAGTNVAMESADVVLAKNNPIDVVRLIKYARATHKKMIQNLFWAVGYNVIAIPLAAGVLYGVGIMLSPAVGAVLMSLSTVIVAINAKIMKVEDVDY